jgi:hypothetical protein
MHFAFYGAGGPIGQWMTPTFGIIGSPLVQVFRGAADIADLRYQPPMSLGKLLSLKIERDRLLASLVEGDATSEQNETC